jgi:hypothetical protein
MSVAQQVYHCRAPGDSNVGTKHWVQALVFYAVDRKAILSIVRVDKNSATLDSHWEKLHSGMRSRSICLERASSGISYFQ